MSREDREYFDRQRKREEELLSSLPPLIEKSRIRIDGTLVINTTSGVVLDRTIISMVARCEWLEEAEKYTKHFTSLKNAELWREWGKKFR